MDPLRTAWILLLVTLTGDACSSVDTLAAGANPVAAQPTSPAAVETTPATPGVIVAFPGAEGFGAHARGGRGGKVCAVTSLAKEGVGSLQHCLDQEGPRVVVFRVSGVIEGPLAIKHGRLTIAGQTSPGGVTIRGGLVCDNVYDPNDCNDVIIRHLRLRGGAPDGLRLGGARDIIVDHCSLAGAEDENVEITRSQAITVQYSVIAEPVGEHHKWGGLLINYSKDRLPLDAISLHHNVWNGVSGRLPELSCEENGDGPGTSACSGHVLRVEISNNVFWDVFDPIWYNRCTGTNEGNDCPISAKNFVLHANFVANLMARRSSADEDAPFIEPAVAAVPANRLFFADNRLLRGTLAKPVTAPAHALTTRNSFPSITLTATDALLAELAANAGALPHDPMDMRLAGYLRGPVDARPPAWAQDQGISRGDALHTRPNATPPPPDSDNDGIPDAWELSHGLDPHQADGSDTHFAARATPKIPGCVPAYTALECYLNELAAQLRAAPVR